MASPKYLCETKEFFIPFPGGQIAAKMWGNEAGIPILALHGWQDNLGTFDRLFPYLSSDCCIVCFDFLGHGLSSHKPAGVFYNYIDMLIEIKRVSDYLNWSLFSILGHSLGATLALMYASLFPNNIVNVISLDIVKPNSRQLKEIPSATKYTILEMIRLEQKLTSPSPVYSPQQAKERFIKAMPESITDAAAEALLKRGTKISPLGDGVVFTRDIRTKTIEGLQMFSHDILKIYLSNLKCNLLIIVGTESKFHNSKKPEEIDDFLDMFKRNCNSFKIVKVNGNHFYHLNNPEVAAPLINTFLEKYGRNKSNL